MVDLEGNTEEFDGAKREYLQNDVEEFLDEAGFDSRGPYRLTGDSFGDVYMHYDPNSGRLITAEYVSVPLGQGNVQLFYKIEGPGASKDMKKGLEEAIKESLEKERPPKKDPISFQHQT